MHFTTLKMIATGGFLAASECTEFVFGQSSAPTPLRELTGTDPPDPDPLAGLRGTLLLSEGKRERGKWNYLVWWSASRCRTLTAVSLHDDATTSATPDDASTFSHRYTYNVPSTAYSRHLFCGGGNSPPPLHKKNLKIPPKAAAKLCARNRVSAGAMNYLNYCLLIFLSISVLYF